MEEMNQMLKEKDKAIEDLSAELRRLVQAVEMMKEEREAEKERESKRKDR